MAANPNPSNSPRLSPLNPNPNLTSAPNPYAQGLGPPFQLQKQAHSASARASNASGTGSTKKSGRGRGHSVSTVPVHLSEIPSGLTAATTGTNHSRSRSASVSGTSLPASPTLSPPVPVSGIHTHTAPTTPTLSPTTTENAQSQSQNHSRRSSWWRREFLSEATTTTTGTASASASHGHGFARPWYTTTNMAATAAASTTGSTASGRRHSVAGTPTAKEKEGAGLGGTVPVEQMENWDITRKRVAQAASSILGNSALMAHEVLLHSVDLFELAPVPGLSLAARTLLEIWDCVQEVDSNRLQCLRLTERCADILLSVRQEVYDAGDEVAEELRLGVERLTESFTQVHTLLIKQASRPFLKRYLKRDEISKQLAVCDVGLQEALGMFSLSIQIRILKQVQLAEARTTERYGGAAEERLPQSKSSFPYAIPSPLSPTNSNAHSAVNLNDSNNHSLLLSRSSLPAPGYAYADSDSSRRKGGSESLQSLHIQGLHGLPPSSSHSSLALAEVEPAESEANLKQALSTFQWPKLPVPPSSGSHTPMPPLPSSASSAPISPGSTSSTPTPTGLLPWALEVLRQAFGTGAGSLESPETETHKEKQKKKTPVAVPVQLIPTKSTIEAAKGVLEEIQHTQNYADLRGIMREALRKGSDVEMIGVLLGGSRSRSEGFGVAGAAEGMGGEQGGSLGRLDAGEMAEAIKTLQRAHEAILERERWETLRGQAQSQAGQVPPPGKSTVTAGGRVPSLAQEAAAIASGDPSTSASDDVPGSMSTSKTITAISGTGNVEEGRPGLGRRTSSSLSTSSAIRSSMSMNALKRITKRMSLQSSVSASREASTSSPLNETSIVEEATEVEEDVGVDMAVVRKMGIGIGMIRKDSSGGSRLIRSKTTSSAVTTASTNDSILSQAGSGSSGSGSGVTTTSGSGSGYGSGGSHTKNDTLTLDKEFIESGIDALRRMSRPTKRRRGEGSIRDGMGMSQSSSVGIGLDRDGDGMRVLPSWTITRYEIDREEKIGIGFFSDVPSPIRMSWSSLGQVLRGAILRGFFVSPYMGNGSLAEFLRGNAIRLNMDANPHTNADGGEEENGNSRIRAASLTLPGYPGWSGGGLGSLVGARRHSPMQGAPRCYRMLRLNSDNGHTRHRSGSDSAAGTASPSSVVVGWASLGLAELEEIPKEWNLLRFMHEIAKGMEYLHSRGVLHGDLKASNVLVDDKIHCVISDFGQSEMRSEAYRISGTPPPHGTLRWQAPELMFGSLTQLTVEMDVYAFAICCTEVLSLGRMPWPFSNDDQVHNQVMSNQRPTVPNTPFTTPELVSLVQSCWATNPFYRPPFSKVASELKGIRKVFGIGFGGPATPGVEGYAYQQPPPPSIPSPDLRPIPLPPSRYQMTVPRTPPRDILNLTATALHAQHQGTPSSSNSNSSSSEDASFRTARDVSTSPHDREGGYEHRETTVPASLSLSASTSSAKTVTPNAPKPSSESPFAPTGALPFSPTSTTTFSPTSSPFSPTIPPFSPTSPSAFSFPSSAGPSSFVPGYSYSASSYAGFGYNNNSNYGVDITRGSGFNPSSISPGIAGTTAQGQLQLQMPETVIYTPSRPPSSTTSSIFTSTPSESQEEEAYDAHGGKTMAMEYDGYDSPPPANELLAEARNERRYRLLLVHDFHPSLTLPLWTPTPIALGAIGYLSKPKGEFITLFNAFHPQKSDSTLAKDLPSVHGYGKVSTGSQRQDKRNAAQRGLDAIAGLLTFKGRGGNVSQLGCAQEVVQGECGRDFGCIWCPTSCQKEDLYFVIGTLDTPEHAVFVSHNHPDGQAHFNVFSSSKSHQPWGRFTTDTDTPFELGGPSYHEPVSGSPLSASKISPQGNYPWNTVLLARLRFKPDVLEPTSL
ncbi:hypothetical protein BT96DRAFT_933245 [Gymnopus androsaceus JB14]|uniref:Protein kinase domain-containing protein n=1 Tax=Gymnopus androsaceus JB14 TaxID=1447944 RepID=A0A6A4IBV4_9AGAR|nr:hypothetical protein BT96DRAFT_933245 [Gymnopus androsaceus JB14]